MKIVVTEVREWELEVPSTIPELDAVAQAEAMVRSGASTALLKRTIHVRGQVMCDGSRRTPDTLRAFLNHEPMGN